MVKNGGFDIFIGVCPLFYMLMDKSIRIVHGCLGFVFPVSHEQGNHDDTCLPLGGVHL